MKLLFLATTFICLSTSVASAQHTYKSNTCKYSILIPKGYLVTQAAQLYPPPTTTVCLSAVDSTESCSSCDPRNTIGIHCSPKKGRERAGVDMTLDRYASLPVSWAITDIVGGAARVHPTSISKKFVTLNGQRAYCVSYDEGGDAYGEGYFVYMHKIRTTAYFLIKGPYMYAVYYKSVVSFHKAADGNFEEIKKKTPTKPEEGLAAIKTFRLL